MRVMEVELRILGMPAPYGSKTCVCRDGRGLMFEQNVGQRPWQTAVRKAAKVWVADHGKLIPRDQPVQVRIDFFLGDPPKSRRGETWVVTKPDADKLARNTLDGLVKGGVLPDDAQVAIVGPVSKRWGNPTGCVVRITPLV